MILRNFAVFEGIDGTGTTTQLRELERRLLNAGAKAWFTCEPTGLETGKFIRRVLAGSFSVHPDTMARLFSADRSEHLYGKGGILERLAAGEAVFTDRYLFSSLAYQGEAGDPNLTRELNARFPLPEFLFFFEIDPELSMARITSRGDTREIYEREEFQRKVQERYRSVIARYEAEEPGMRVIKVDASLSIEEISEKIWSVAGNLPIM